MTRGQQPVSDQYFDQQIIVSDVNLDQLITSFYKFKLYIQRTSIYYSTRVDNQHIIAVTLNYSKKNIY